MTEMKARLVDKDGNPLGTAANPLKISGDVGGGVPDGGTTGQVLQKKTDADQDTEWGDVSGSSTAWGDITGTLSDQTDLGNVLDGKIAATDVTYENLDANGDVGSVSGTVCAGDDSRLSDSRTPTSHGNEAHSSTFLTEIAWGDITGTLSDQTDLGTVLDGKASKTDSDLTLYVYEDATGDADGSSKANGFTSLQDAIDAIPDVAQYVTIIVSKGSTNYLGDTTTIHKAGVKSLTIKGEFYAYEACDANAVVGKVVDADADFSDFEVGDRVVCTHYSGTVGSSSIDDYFYATITEVGEGYVQTSEETKVPTTGWKYLINQTVFDGDNTTNVPITGNFEFTQICGLEFYNWNSWVSQYTSCAWVYCIFDDIGGGCLVASSKRLMITTCAILNIRSNEYGLVISDSSGGNIDNILFTGKSGSTNTIGCKATTGAQSTISYCGFFNITTAINSVYGSSAYGRYSYIASTCTYGAYGYNITLVSCTNNAATPVYNLTSGGSIKEWDGQALPSIDDATGGQVLALKSDKSGIEFASKQPLDATLTALAGVTSDANKLPYFTGEDQAGVTDLTAFARTILDDADAATVRGTIGSQQATNDLIAETTIAEDDFIPIYDKSAAAHRKIPRSHFLKGVPRINDIIGVKWNSASSSPSLVRVDEDLQEITSPYLGGWSKFFDSHAIWGQMWRCQLSAAGVPTFGTNARGDGLTLTNDYIMTRVPRVYAKFVYDDGNLYWLVSPEPSSGFSLHPAFYQRGHSATPANQLYVGAYTAGATGGTTTTNGAYNTLYATSWSGLKLTSKSGVKNLTGSGSSGTMAQFEAAGNAIGTGWGLMNFHTHCLLQLLFYIEYASFDSQSKLGLGRTNASNTAAALTGTYLNQVGAGAGTDIQSLLASNGTYGSTTNDYHSVVWRGIENLWGNIWQFVPGYNTTDTSHRILNRDGTGTIADVMASGSYESITSPIPLNGVDNISGTDAGAYCHGYVSALARDSGNILGPMFVPGALSGASDTYLTDYLYSHQSGISQTGVLLSGGSWYHGLNAGVGSRLSNNGPSYVGATVGGRLEFLG